MSRRPAPARAGDPLVRVLAAMRPDLGRTGLAVLVGVAATGAAVGLMGTSGWLISRAAQQPPVRPEEACLLATGRRDHRA